jgi:hypothetical protein
MGWSGLTLVSDNDLGALEPEATNGSWGAITWANQRAEAKRDLKIWLETDFAHIPGVADRVRDTHVFDYVYGYTGGGYADLTDAASDDAENDVDLSDVFATFGTDKLYLGAPGEFDGIAVRMLSTLNANAAVLAVKYWGGTGWTTLTHTDGTAASAKTFGKGGRITWTVPTDWERRTLNSSADAYFWIELAVSAALTADTVASQILQVRAPDPLKRICALRAMGYIYKNLAAQAPSTDYWGGRCRNQFKTGYWDEADALYAALRDKGGIPIDLDNDNVISVGMETNIVNPIRMGRG